MNISSFDHKISLIINLIFSQISKCSVDLPKGAIWHYVTSTPRHISTKPLNLEQLVTVGHYRWTASFPQNGKWVEDELAAIHGSGGVRVSVANQWDFFIHLMYGHRLAFCQ